LYEYQRARGKIPWEDHLLGREIDRQNILPNGNKSDIEDAVSIIFNNLYSKGGVIGQCEFGPAAKPENIFYVFESWNNALKK
jgi:hypothetical protein